MSCSEGLLQGLAVIVVSVGVAWLIAELVKTLGGR